MKSYIVTNVPDGHQTVLNYQLNYVFLGNREAFPEKYSSVLPKGLMTAVLHLIYENDARCKHIRSAFSVRGLLKPVRSVSLREKS